MYARSAARSCLQTTGVVRCDQPRALYSGSRRGRKLESVPQAILDCYVPRRFELALPSYSRLN